MKTFNFTCQDCNETWQNCVPPKSAGAVAERGCSICKGKNVTFEVKKNDEATGNGGFMAIDASRIGRHKPPKAFTEGVLKRIKHHHAHTNISVD